MAKIQSESFVHELSEALFKMEARLKLTALIEKKTIEDKDSKEIRISKAFTI